MQVAEGEKLHAGSLSARPGFGPAGEGHYRVAMTVTLRMEAPEKPDDPADPPEPDNEPAERDRPPAPEGPMPAEAPEVPADEPKEA